MKLKELDELNELEKISPSLVKFKTLDSVEYKGKNYPIRSVTIGPDDPSVPTLGLFGGVHGLEKVGSQVIVAYFASLFEQLKWDKDLLRRFEDFRIVSIPIVNPVGMARFSRSNGNDVDLMRNAPVDADPKHTFPLVSGHRISPVLPWYRGEGLEKESQVLFQFVKEEMFPSNASIALDIHSGFGTKDQLWYPYAKTKEPFARIAEVKRLMGLLDSTYPYHIYKIEGQAENYLANGDLWDYFFDIHQQDYKQDEHLFIPLTLELGSWNWIKKNPKQFFSKLGLFHPIKEHRHARTMRRHLLLLNFLMRATKNHTVWR